MTEAIQAYERAIELLSAGEQFAEAALASHSLVALEEGAEISETLSEDVIAALEHDLTRELLV